MTILAIYHGALLVTMGDYLWNNILIKVDLYSAVIFKRLFLPAYILSVFN